MSKLQTVFLIILISFLGHSYSNAQENIMENSSTVVSENKPLSFQKGEVLQGKIYRFIQFEKLPNQLDQEDLKNLGINLLEYRRENIYLASIPSTISHIDLESIGVRKISEINEAQKASFETRNEIIPEWAIEGEDVKLSLQYHKDLNHELVKSLCAKHGIRVLKSNGINNVIEVQLKRSKLNDIVSLPFISNIEPVSAPPIPEDKLGRNLHRVNRINSTTGAIRNYTGNNINVVVRDDGAVFEHIDFKGRMDQSSSGDSRGSHGDGVAGLMVGAGNLDPLNQGMAYGSDFYVIDYTSEFLDETMDLHNQNNVLITNSSYSNGCNAGYTNTSTTVDQQMKDNPTLLHVFSAGNQGQGILNDDEVLVECGYGAGLTWGNITGGHKIGKNVIAVANMNSSGVVVESSSRGPAFDGRIKPDISANGFDHVSTIEAQDYAPFGGTSAAAPVVAGISAMLYEAYEINHGNLPDAALIKAIILNTANDTGNKGPDFINGWGSINAHRAALAIEEGRFMKMQIGQDDTQVHQFDIPDNVKQARFMVYWPDREGRVSATHHLINNINTFVTDGTTNYLPWVLDHSPDPALLAKPATKGGDNLNNMEQVAIDNPSPGSYSLRVTGAEIPFGDIDYYLVWEYRTNEIDVTFPNGGENVEKSARETIHWDAEGDEGEFTIELLNGNGDLILSENTDGSRRIKSIIMPENFDANSKIRVSRNGVSDESDESFIISDMVSNLKTEKVDENVVLTFEGVEDAVNYNVYALGDKYMEKVSIADSTSYILPDIELFKINWIAVSPNFEGGKEGLRSRAIPVRPAPTASASNDKDNEPCVNEIITFSTSTIDTLTNYEWTFGDDAIPEMAFTAGPHTVRYTKKGSKVGYLKVSHEGGNDNEIFFIDVKSSPTLTSITSNQTDEGIFDFSSNAKNVTSYLWDFGDGNTSTDQSPTHTYTQDGLFIVKLVASSSCGDVTKEIEVDVSLSTSTNEISLDEFTVHPNPSHGQITITLPVGYQKDFNIQIWNMEGKLVVNRNCNKNQSLKINDLTPGIYQVHVTSSNQKAIKKIIIQ